MTDETKTIFITEIQAAEMMGYTPSSLRVRRSRKKAPAYYKIGGKISYDIEDVKAYIKNAKVVPEEEGNKNEH